MDSVNVVIQMYNGICSEQFAFKSEKSAFKKVCELAGQSFLNIREFADWRREEMTDENEVIWYQLNIED